MKTPTEEIHYLGQMLAASTPEDVQRINAIIDRLQELKEE